MNSLQNVDDRSRRTTLSLSDPKTVTPDILYRASNVVFLDTETTGLKAGMCDIIEIAVVDWYGRALVDTLVATKRTIPHAVQELTGIRENMVNSHIYPELDVPSWADAWRDVIRAVRNNVVVIFNAEFDVAMIQGMHRNYQTPSLPEIDNAVCAMKMYAGYRNVYDARRRRQKWFSLAKAREACGIRDVQTHRAADDARMTMRVVEYMARNWSAVQLGRRAKQERLI